MKEVTAAIIIRDKKVLIARRAQGEKFAGSWEFPGGKVEAFETPKECLRRELYEELGIETRIGEFIAESIYEYPNGLICLLAFTVDIISGEICLTVHDAYRWVDVCDLLKYDLLPADIPIANRLMYYTV